MPNSYLHEAQGSTDAMETAILSLVHACLGSVSFLCDPGDRTYDV